MKKSSFALWSLVLVFAFGCGEKDKNEATNAPAAGSAPEKTASNSSSGTPIDSNTASAPLSSDFPQYQFPTDKIGQAIDFTSIGAGNYLLKKISILRDSSPSDKVSYMGVHELATPGIFKSGKDITQYSVHWKGNDQNKKDGEYHYTYEEINLPLSIFSNEKQVNFGKTIYYFNKVRTDTDYLNWLAEDEDSTNGKKYYEVFVLGTPSADHVYTHNMGYTNVTAKGIVLLEGNQLQLHVEYLTDAGKPEQIRRLVEFQFVKTE